MATTTTELMTFAEFEKLPDEPGKLELLRGELIRMPPPKRKHGEGSKRLFLALHAMIESKRRDNPGFPLGEAQIEMGYRISRDPDTWLVPDVSVTHPNQPGEDYLEGAPAIAIEVASESNMAEDMDVKVREYLAAGALEVWVVYQKTRRAWTYYASKPTAELGEEIIRSGLIPGEIRLADILG